MTYRRLRLGLAIVALVFFVAAFFLRDPTLRDTILTYQITPALADFSAGTYGFVLAVVAITSLIGRGYCSVFCPAGLLQELAFISGRIAKKAKTRFAPAGKPRLLLYACALFLLIGWTTLVNLVDPVGWFGKIMAPLAEAVVSWQDGVERFRGYLGWSGVGFVLGIVLIIGVSFFRGRWFCDRLCPVGAALGQIATVSLRNIHLDPERCVSCHRCASVCPTRCIDSKRKQLDLARCVLCFACLDSCTKHAITYGVKDNPKRRSLLKGGASLVAPAVYLAAGGLRGKPFTTEAVLPPGAHNADNYFSSCVGCQSCAAVCPEGIIKPSFPGMQPELRFDLGYCQYACLLCSKACPAGAIKPLTLEKKKITRIAKTELSIARCIVMTEGTACGACAEVCPTRALSMETWEEGKPPRPVFYPDHCIGCGACRHVCPVHPLAFTIRGLARHEIALPMRESAREENSSQDNNQGLSDFPF